MTGVLQGDRTTLLFTGDEVRSLLSMDACIAAVEAAFRRHAGSDSPAPAVLGMRFGKGGFHVKAAALSLERPYFVAKLNANHPENPRRFGLPTIQGVVALCDGENGRLLALMDSMEITRIRTAAATAVAAKHLARPDSASLMLFGCGRQGRAHIESLSRVLPLRRLIACDTAPGAAPALAVWANESLGLATVAVEAGHARARARECDVIVTCTPSRQPLLGIGDVGPGTFVAGVGADDAGKQELEPELLAAAQVVVDILDQCAMTGDLRHALDAGAMTRADVHAELAEVLTGRKTGRTTDEEITVFDSTGTALEDLAAAVALYERAVSSGRGGVALNLGGAS